MPYGANARAPMDRQTDKQTNKWTDSHKTITPTTKAGGNQLAKNTIAM